MHFGWLWVKFLLVHGNELTQLRVGNPIFYLLFTNRIITHEFESIGSIYAQENVYVKNKILRETNFRYVSKVFGSSNNSF